MIRLDCDTLMTQSCHCTNYVPTYYFVLQWHFFLKAHLFQNIYNDYTFSNKKNEQKKHKMANKGEQRTNNWKIHSNWLFLYEKMWVLFLNKESYEDYFISDQNFVCYIWNICLNLFEKFKCFTTDQNLYLNLSVLRS